ncbi:hypothetical protein BS78_08G043300, partial [Paspalum vaginatum]
METPWVIKATATDAEAGEEAAAQHAAVAPDFTFPVALPPRVNVLAAGRNAHPEPNLPDAYPYIISAGRSCLLAHFAEAPFYGTQFEDRPHASHLVLVHHFQTAEGQTTASARLVTDRTGYDPVVHNIGNVVLIPVTGGSSYLIAELQVHKGSGAATIVFLHTGPLDSWYEKDVMYPLAEADRRWVPHGGVYVDGMLWWFDLSWGILGYGDGASSKEPPELLFHDLQGDRALREATPSIHTRRCVAVSRDVLRYVEIVPDEGGAAAAVTMWSLGRVPDGGGWQWDMNYEMSFENIWNDHSYTKPQLPRTVPVLALVSPSDPELVYFALEQQLFGVNVPEHRVLHREAYELVKMPEPEPQHPASGRYVIAWELPPAIAQALGKDHPFAGLDAEQLPAEH